MPTVYLNGRFMADHEATVPVLDRGFIFGDGVYEVIPVYHGHAFRLEEHLSRLDNSLNAVRIAHPMDHATWSKVFADLIAKNGGGHQSLYVQVTRGVAPRDHAFPKDTVPTVFAMSSPLKPVPEDVLRQGISAITLDDIRWRNCHIKAIALLPNILLRQQALDAGAAEAILIRDDLATEGAASNVFIVRKGTLITPPKGPFLLPGITRDLILELARSNAIPCAETDITTTELHAADEIWMTSSTKEILPVTRLDNVAIGNGLPGPLWHRMHALFQAYKAALKR